MSYNDHARAIWRLGLPLIGGHLAQMAVGLTDTLMLGWYSVEALAAVALANSVFFTFFITLAGFAMAVMPLVAEASAQDDEVTVRRVARMGMWLSIFAAVLVLPVFYFSKPIFLAMGQDEGVAQTAQDYLRVAGFGMIPALLVMVLKSYLAALEHTRVVFWVTVVAAIVNAFANYSLIFGNWGAPELGARGAAVASLAVHSVSLIGVVIYALRVLPHHQLFRRFWRPDGEILLSVSRLGVPIGLTALAESGLFTGSAIMMGWFGAVTLAAHGIAGQIVAILFMAQVGLNNAATVRAGNAYGRRDMTHLLRGARMVVVLSVGISLLCVVVVLSIPELLVGAFVDPTDPDRDAILAMGVTFLGIALFFLVVDGIQIVVLGLLRGVKDTKIPMVIGAVCYWGVGLGTGYLLGVVAGWEGVGVWIGLVVGLTTAAITLGWRFFGPKVRALKVQFGPDGTTTAVS